MLRSKKGICRRKQEGEAKGGGIPYYTIVNNERLSTTSSAERQDL